MIVKGFHRSSDQSINQKIKHKIIHLQNSDQLFTVENQWNKTGCSRLVLSMLEYIVSI